MVSLGVVSTLLAAAGGLATGVGALTAKKPRVTAQPIATRDDAAREIEREDALARRRGAAADRIVGSGGMGGIGGIGGIGRMVPGS